MRVGQALIGNFLGFDPDNIPVYRAINNVAQYEVRGEPEYLKQTKIVKMHAAAEVVMAFDDWKLLGPCSWQHSSLQDHQQH